MRPRSRSPRRGWGSRCALVAVALLSAASARAGEVVRIALAVDAARVTLSGAGLTMTPLAEQADRVKLEGERAEVVVAGDAVVVNGAALEAAGATFTAEGPLRTSATPIALEEGEVEVRRAAGGLQVVHTLPLEDYVAAVVGAEMPLAFPPEALKAQAVATRTFAVYKKLEAVAEGRGWHLGATVLDQVYRGTRVDPRARAAALATEGEVLVYDHAPIAAYFHSTCGGRTERGADALGRDLPYLVSVPCTRCRESPRYRWEVKVSAEELGRAAGLPGPAVGASVASRTASGRAARVAILGAGRRVVLSAVDLRQRLGYDRLPSLAFEVSLGGGEALFRGRGAGHGAGLCQWGAAGAARTGESYRQILAYYYRGTELIRMY